MEVHNLCRLVLHKSFSMDWNTRIAEKKNSIQSTTILLLAEKENPWKRIYIYFHAGHLITYFFLFFFNAHV